MHDKFLRLGMALWFVGTVALRVGGHYALRPGMTAWRIVILFALSFVLLGWVVRRACAALGPDKRIGAAVSIALPTLLFDPFSSAFFPVVFPNMAPEVAGVFGGWMLICCAGAMVGALLREKTAA